MKTSPLINDEQSLVGAVNRFGRALRVYDDGFGPLFVHRDSMGISGIVRAQTWEDAYSICEDEFFTAADADANEEAAKIEAMPDGEEKNHAQACWNESYGHRSNGRAEADGSTSYIYAKDLNGDCLDLLTPELLAQLEITLQIETPIDAQLEAMLPKWEKLVASLIPEIRDEYRATDDPEDDEPAICLTVGFTPETRERSASWSYQTGDNSFTGGAYGHPHWAVVTITRDCKPDEVAKEIADQLGELVS